jgi:hypothetical protein
LFRTWGQLNILQPSRLLPEFLICRLVFGISGPLRPAYRDLTYGKALTQLVVRRLPVETLNVCGANRLIQSQTVPNELVRMHTLVHDRFIMVFKVLGRSLVA